MPYRALTHGRVKNSILDVNGNIFTPSTHSQAAAITSQNGVANNGPVTVQRNKNNQSNKQPKRSYARRLSSNFLLRPNAYGNPNTFVSGQGKGFPNATPQISVGSRNRFARRAISRRAVTRMIEPTSRGCCDDYCPSNSITGISNGVEYILNTYIGNHHVGYTDRSYQKLLIVNGHFSGINFELDFCDSFGSINKHTAANYNGSRIWGIYRWITNTPGTWFTGANSSAVVLHLSGNIPTSQQPNLIINGVAYPPQESITGTFVGFDNNNSYTVIRYGDASNNLNQLFSSQQQNDLTIQFS